MKVILLSLFAWPAFAFNWSSLEGDYTLTEGRWGMCTESIRVLNQGDYGLLVGGISFRNINGDTIVHDDSMARSETRSWTRGNTLYKRRSVYDKANGRTSTQDTRIIKGRNSFRMVDKDIDIPATTVDCTYRKR